MRAVLSAVVVSLLASNVAVAPAEAGSWETLQLETGTYARWHRPATSPAGPLPVIVFFHGAGSSPEAWIPLLTDLAESRAVVLLLPKSISPYGWGVGADQESVEDAIEQLDSLLSLDRTRLYLAGHSSGGSYAYVLGLAGRQRFAAIFTLSAPYRTVLELGHRGYVPPLRLYYGHDDPNFRILPPLIDMLDRLEVPWQLESRAGFGHSSWPPTTLEDGFDFLLGERYPLPGPCRPSPTTLCLRNGRFAVDVEWRDFEDRLGTGKAVSGELDTTGSFWFFSEDNLEMLVKVLDGCHLTGHYWVFASSTTTVEYRLRVRDLAAGAGVEVAYENPLGQAAPAITDTAALATCP